MELGVLLPHAGLAANPGGIRDVALAAERMGFASVWVGDHIVFPEEQRSRYPYSQAAAYPVPADRAFLESFTTLAFVAGVTERVRLGVAVCVAPYRHPLMVAKIVASLDFLSQGRVILGVGAGWLEEEFAALQVPFEDRAARTDEMLEILRRVWRAPGSFSYRGQFYNIDRVYARPQPVQQELPIWIGGGGKAARLRTVRYGQAWYPTHWHLSPEDIAEHRRFMNELGAQAGRDADSIGVAVFIPMTVTEEDDPRMPWETPTVTGTPRRIAALLQQYATAGVSHAVLSLGRGAASRVAAMEAIVEEMQHHPSH